MTDSLTDAPDLKVIIHDAILLYQNRHCTLCCVCRIRCDQMKCIQESIDFHVEALILTIGIGRIPDDSDNKGKGQGKK